MPIWRDAVCQRLAEPAKVPLCDLAHQFGRQFCHWFVGGIISLAVINITRIAVSVAHWFARRLYHLFNIFARQFVPIARGGLAVGGFLCGGQHDGRVALRLGRNALRAVDLIVRRARPNPAAVLISPALKRVWRHPGALQLPYIRSHNLGNGFCPRTCCRIRAEVVARVMNCSSKTLSLRDRTSGVTLTEPQLSDCFRAAKFN
jgi:hypothetical protein